MKVLKTDEYSKMILYHGTKEKFKAFDMSKINSGWGEQAYGYGFYLTNSYETAKAYSRGGIVMKVAVPRKKYLSYSGITLSEKNTIAKKFFKYYTEVDEYGKEAYPDEELRKTFWDEECRYLLDCEDGGDIYGTIASLVGSDEETSKFLRNMGYIGLEFQSNNSVTGEKFNNYVIFDAKDIEIL